jgi:hypothetical protein
MAAWAKEEEGKGKSLVSEQRAIRAMNLPAYLRLIVFH